MLILPSTVWKCRRCNKWKEIEGNFSPDYRPGYFFKKTCNMCVAERAKEKRDAMRVYRLKLKYKELPYVALDKMFHNHPDLLEKALNLDGYLFRKYLKQAQEEFIENEKARLETFMNRPQANSEYMRENKKKRLKQEKEKWISLTGA